MRLRRSGMTGGVAMLIRNDGGVTALIRIDLGAGDVKFSMINNGFSL